MGGRSHGMLMRVPDTCDDIGRGLDDRGGLVEYGSCDVDDRGLLDTGVHLVAKFEGAGSFVKRHVHYDASDSLRVCARQNFGLLRSQ